MKVRIVEIARRVAACFTVAVRRNPIVAHGAVVALEFIGERLLGESEDVLESIAAQLERRMEEAHAGRYADLALRVALLDQHQTFLMAARAHVAAAHRPAGLQWMRLGL